MRVPSIELMQQWVLSKRDSHISQDKLRLIRSLEQGYLGEVAVDACYSYRWSDRLLYLTDLYLNFNGSCQIDAIGIGAGIIVVFEIKNYSGRYEYRNGQFYLNGREFSHNSLAQLTRSVNIVQNIFRSMNISVKVIGKIILANSSGEFFCDSDEISKKFLPINQLKTFWSYIYQKEAGQPIGKKEYITSIIKNYSNEDRYIPNDIPFSELKLGPICPKCYETNLISKRFHVVCSTCHFKEEKSTAMHRLTCELGVLKPNSPIIPKNIHQLSNGFFTKNACSKYLNDFLTKSINSSKKNTTYQNPKMLYRYYYPYYLANQQL